MMFRAFLAASLVWFASGMPTVHAADYSEFAAGDLSNNPAAPTLWALDAGANVLAGRTGPGDYDVLRFTIPPGSVLQSIVIGYHEDLSRVFTGLQAGTVWTAGLGFNVDPAPMLGWVDFPVNPEIAHTGVDILTDIAQAPGSQGFTPPLAAGDYTMLFQNEFTVVRHALIFNVADAVSSMAADFNQDNQIDGVDLTIWGGAFGASAAGDADGDGNTAGADFLLWQRNFGFAAGGAVALAAPEPGTLLLMAFALAAIPGARRRAARRV